MMRNPFKSRDKKPVLLSFILQRDDCSRLLGEFGESHLKNCSKLIIVWKNGNEKSLAVKSISTSQEEAIGMLIRAAGFIGESNEQ